MSFCLPLALIPFGSFSGLKFVMKHQTFIRNANLLRGERVREDGKGRKGMWQGKVRLFLKAKDTRVVRPIFSPAKFDICPTRLRDTM